MSQYVQRATGMATKAMEVAKTRVLPPAVEYYNATMAKNAQYVVKDPEAVDKLGRQLVFSNLAKCVQPARTPPPHDPRARAITLGRTPARAGNREPRARGDDARHPVWTRSCLTAATPPPLSSHGPRVRAVARDPPLPSNRVQASGHGRGRPG